MKDRSNSAQLWKWFTIFPITSPPHHPFPCLHPFCFSLSDYESISGSLKTCQMCSDQCNGLRVHYIHSAPFYEVTSWRGLPAGALYRTVNQGLAEVGVRKEERSCDSENIELHTNKHCNLSVDHKIHTHFIWLFINQCSQHWLQIPPGALDVIFCGHYQHED